MQSTVSNLNEVVKALTADTENIDTEQVRILDFNEDLKGIRQFNLWFAKHIDTKNAKESTDERIFQEDYICNTVISLISFQSNYSNYSLLESGRRCLRKHLQNRINSCRPLQSSRAENSNGRATRRLQGHSSIFQHALRIGKQSLFIGIDRVHRVLSGQVSICS